MLTRKLCCEAGWQLSFPRSGVSREPAVLPQISEPESSGLLSDPPASNRAQTHTVTVTTSASHERVRYHPRGTI